MKLIDLLSRLDTGPTSALEIARARGTDDARGLSAIVARYRQAWWAGLIEPLLSGYTGPRDPFVLTEQGRARLEGVRGPSWLLISLRTKLCEGWISSGELATWALGLKVKISTLDHALVHLRAIGEIEERSVKVGVWLVSTEYRRAA